MSSHLHLLRLMLHACPKKLIGGFCVQIFDYLLETLSSIWLLRYVVESIETGRDFRDVLMPLVMILIAYGVHLLLKCWYECTLKEEGKIKLREELDQILFEKAYEMDVVQYENQAYYTLFSRAIYYVNNATELIFNNACNMIGFSAMAIGAGLILFSIDKVLPLFALLCVPAALAGKKFKELTGMQQQQFVDHNRKKEYVKKVILKRESAQEMRTSTIGHVLFEMDQEAVNANQAIINNNWKKLAFYSLVRDITMIDGVRLLCLLYIVYRIVVVRSLTMADFSVIFTAIMALVSRLRRIIEGLTAVQEYKQYEKDMEKFMAIKPQITGTLSCKERFQCLSLKHVSFSYHQDEVLHDISFDIRAGEKIAIVGRNGSGKSTLVKLLLRLYDPISGQIEYNHIDIRKYKPQEYRRHFSTVFQDFQLFSLSARENVAMDSNVSSEEVIKALSFAGISYRFPEGEHLDDLVGHDFDRKGLMFSGGEKQRIAIARMKARKTDICILDEPSSALDPISEAEMFDKMEKASRDCTTIYISHRLSSVKLADRILVMDQGRLVEQGNHEELMKKEGIYAELFRKQASYYTEGEGEYDE